MKKIARITILAFLFSFTAKAQNIQWAKQIVAYTFSSPNSIVYDNNGNVYVAGWFNDSIKIGPSVYTAGTSSDMFIAKFDTAGTLIWSAVAADSYLMDIAADNAGNIYFVADAYGSVTYGSSTINALGVVYGKIDNTGIFQWVKTNSQGYGATEKIWVDASGNIYLGGDRFSNMLEFDGTVQIYSQDLGGGNYGDVFVVKMDNAGNALWARSGGAANTGGNLDGDLLKGLVVDNLGNVYISGYYDGNAYFESTLLVQTGGTDLFYTKYDASGNMIWAKKAGSSQDEYCWDMAIDANDQLYITGNFLAPLAFAPLAAITNSGGGNEDMFIVKLDTGGVAKWVRKGGGTSYDEGLSVTCLNDQIYVSGYMGGNASFNGVPLTVTSGMGFIVKYDFLGNVVWAQNYGGAASLGIYHLTNDTYTGIYATGLYNASATLGSTTLPLTGASADVMVFNLDDCANIQLSPSVDSITLCSSGSTLLSAPAGFSAYLWSNAATTQSISVSLPASYYSTVTYPDGCRAISNQVHVSNTAMPQAPSICMVTVDGGSVNNIIYWDRAATVNVDSFIVYREVSTSIYKRIGAVSIDSLGQFVDTSRSVGPANGDPNVGSYRYKLQVRDSCGNYSALSPYHNTIYIIDAGAGQFTWSIPYTIEGGANPVANYVLLCDTANVDVWGPVATVSGTQSSAVDPGFATHGTIANWRVKTAWSINCDPESRVTVNTTRSNIKHASMTVGMDPLNLNSSVVVYPNPATNEAFISLSPDIKSANLRIVNMIGQQVFSEVISSVSLKQVDISNYAKGMYTVEVESKGMKVYKKLIVK